VSGDAPTVQGVMARLVRATHCAMENVSIRSVAAAPYPFVASPNGSPGQAGG
jgi:hypothetical protein